MRNGPTTTVVLSDADRFSPINGRGRVAFLNGDKCLVPTITEARVMRSIKIRSPHQTLAGPAARGAPVILGTSSLLKNPQTFAGDERKESQ
jgi:hypothetical protein